MGRMDNFKETSRHNSNVTKLNSQRLYYQTQGILRITQDCVLVLKLGSRHESPLHTKEILEWLTVGKRKYCFLSNEVSLGILATLQGRPHFQE